MYSRVPALAVACGVAAVLGFLSNRWKAIECPEGAYSVEMPGAPQKTTDAPIVTELGTLQTYTQRVECKGIRYWVTYGDLPPGILEALPAEDLLSFGRWGIAGNGKGALLQDEPIDLNGVPGQALLARDFQANFQKSRIYINGARLYEVSVGYPHHLKESPEIDRFLGSFHITAQ